VPLCTLSCICRLEVMVAEILLAVKNNNVNKIPNYDPSHFEHLKKTLKGYLRSVYFWPCFWGLCSCEPIEIYWQWCGSGSSRIWDFLPDLIPTYILRTSGSFLSNVLILKCKCQGRASWIYFFSYGYIFINAYGYMHSVFRVQIHVDP